MNAVRARRAREVTTPAPARLGVVSLGVMLVACLAPAALAGTDGLELDITNTSLEELYELEITTLSRTEQSYRTSAAALFVVTHDDLARSGVTSIPEALRLVPGVQVAKVDSSKWAVSIRGFAARTANKLLVLIDGRSIYNPLFAGVLWEIRDVSIEDVERIEVIRGPGGTLWGANAVNGVINIITKNAAVTEGTLVRVGSGDEERALVVARHGWAVGDGHVRVFGKYFDRDEGFVAGGKAADDWSVGRLGFRADWGDAESAFTLSGGAYDGEVGEDSGGGLTQDVEHSGNHVVFRWDGSSGPGLSRSVKFYHDRTHLDNVLLGERRNTFDLEFQQEHRRADGHALVWGLGYRATHDDITNSPFLVLDPTERSDALYSVFAQGVIPLRDERLELSAGTKLERNDYTGTEIQPSVRLAWTPQDSVTLWSAVSRAVRTPSRLEVDFASPITGPSHPRAETLHAYEAGARWRPDHRIVIDTALFFNDYDRLVTLEGTQIGYEMFGHTSGIETNVSWRARNWWRIDTAMSVLDVELELEPGSVGGTDPNLVERSDPGFQMVVRNLFDIGEKTTLDLVVRHAGELAAQDVPSYTVLDFNLAWHLRPGMRLALRGRNLLDSHHAEQSSASTTEVEPDVFFNFVVDF